MALERELATYRLALPALLNRKGQFVLIHEDTVAGVYPTREAALDAGYEKFELKPFMVREIQETEPVYVLRGVPTQPCP